MVWLTVLGIVVAAATTLLAAYWGARAAFDFNNKQEAARLRAQQFEECNRAMLVLSRQYNWLLNYRAQRLNPTRDSVARHLAMRPNEPLDYRHWTVDLPALAFLVQTAATELPFMLGLVDEKFHGVIASINMRSNDHREFQRVLAGSELGSLEELPLDAVHKAIGPRLTMTLRGGTDQIYDLTESAIAALEKTGRDGRDVLSTLFRGATIFGFAPPHPDGTAAPT